MSKELSDMTNEELWALFPIIIEEHNEIWKINYIKEKELIEKQIGKQMIKRINHYGSTSVPNLLAKPTIDILLEVSQDIEVNKLIEDMNKIGYGYSPQANNPAPHMMFLKGYTPEGFKGQVCHIHVRYSGDWDELYFRDYLIEHHEVAKAYGKHKMELMVRYQNDRDGYTKAKTDFIKTYTERAKKELEGKYMPE